MPRATLEAPSSAGKGSSHARRVGALLTAAGLLLGACSAGAGTPSPSIPAASSGAASPTQAPLPSPTLASAPTQPAYPLRLTDDTGTVVTLPAEPARIVSLQPATTETLYALGGGARLVGDTNFDDYPAAAKALPHVASYQGVSIEQLVALKPDLVLAGGNGGNPAADIARLRSLGIPVIVVYAATVEAVLADIRLVGEASGLYPAALTLTDAMEARMAAISAAASAAGSRPRTFYEIDHQPEIYGPADDSFVADMVTRAGGQVITTGSSTSYTMPLERLVAADPQVIVLGDADYGTTAAQVSGRGAPWTAMSAVRDGAVRPIDDIIVTRPGPRLADGLAALALAVHPGLALPGGAGSPTPTGAASPTP